MELILLLKELLVLSVLLRIKGYEGETMKAPISAILAVLALVLALLAILDLVRAGTALSLAVMLLSLAFLLPGLSGMRRAD